MEQQLGAMDDLAIKCPVCGQPTANLKRYRTFDRFIFLFIAAWARPAIHVACPSCMRKILLKKAFSPLDILMGNVAWILFVIPMCLVQCIATTTKGHSKSIRESPMYKQFQMRMQAASQTGAVPFFPGMAVVREGRNKK
jgi:endogenous inhibitor of DNA gyrase (YacG/DUF329 family)